MTRPLLDVRQLSTWLYGTRGVSKAVNQLSFAIDRGEILGIVGESGSGKSMACLSIVKLLPRGGRIVHGEILFDGDDIIKKDDDAMKAMRGKRIAMVLQDPLTSLNPLYSIGNQVTESLRAHTTTQTSRLRSEVINLLELVGIPAAAIRYKQYPHQFSGGMRQRAAIAMSIASEPELLIADEPTTALDVTIQAQILHLLREIRDQRRLTIILVTHDLAVVAQTCDRVVVMYAGRVVESASVYDLFSRPRHPYTRGLLDSIPIMSSQKRVLYSIPGHPPNPLNLPQGCPFWPRCDNRLEHCQTQDPPTFGGGTGHEVRCWLYEGVPQGE